MFDSFKTRLEEMFEMCVRLSYAVLMQEILPRAPTVGLTCENTGFTRDRRSE